MGMILEAMLVSVEAGSPVLKWKSVELAVESVLRDGQEER